MKLIGGSVTSHYEIIIIMALLIATVAVWHTMLDADGEVLVHLREVLLVIFVELRPLRGSLGVDCRTQGFS